MDWVRSLFDDEAFAEEQAKLAGVWTFLGLASDLADDEAWITGRIGGRPVFVQRFGDDLRGFENVCAHRQFPLRQGPAGRGPMVCGFHHWRYDADGRAVGVPIAADAYGCTAEALDARLAPVDVATCGELVFGRFRAAAAAADETGPDLEAFLGPTFPILASICDLSGAYGVLRFGREVAANWKLMIAITLDDYHTPAVHRRPRYLRRDEFEYWRFGPHSAHVVDRTRTLEMTAQSCAAGEFSPTTYKLFNIFPGLIVGLFKAGPYLYVLIQQFEPAAADLTRWRAWCFRSRWRHAPEPSVARLAPAVTDRIVRWFIRREAGKVTDEDHAACEALQTTARQARPPSRLSAHEERVAWFYEAWRKAMTV